MRKRMRKGGEREERTGWRKKYIERGKGERMNKHKHNQVCCIIFYCQYTLNNFIYITYTSHVHLIQLMHILFTVKHTTHTLYTVKHTTFMHTLYAVKHRTFMHYRTSCQGC